MLARTEERAEDRVCTIFCRDRWVRLRPLELANVGLFDVEIDL